MWQALKTSRWMSIVASFETPAITGRVDVGLQILSGKGGPLARQQLAIETVKFSCVCRIGFNRTRHRSQSAWRSVRNSIIGYRTQTVEEISSAQIYMRIVPQTQERSTGRVFGNVWLRRLAWLLVYYVPVVLTSAHATHYLPLIASRVCLWSSPTRIPCICAAPSEPLRTTSRTGLLFIKTAAVACF